MFVHFGHQTQDTARSERAVAVLPLAAMEAHGPHLPLATDALIAEGILDRASEMATGPHEVLRLPVLWLGASAEHGDRAGTLSQEPELLIAQIVSIGEGLAKRGISRIVLFNGHGGNIAPAGLAALKLRTRFNMLAASAHWLDFGLPQGMSAPAPVMSDVHGGWVETSVMLHLSPDLVVRGAISNRPASPPAPSLFPSGPINWGWKTDDLTEQGGDGGWIGEARHADPALGARMVDHAAQKLNALLEEIAAARWPRA